MKVSFHFKLCRFTFTSYLCISAIICALIVKMSYAVSSKTMVRSSVSLKNKQTDSVDDSLEGAIHEIIWKQKISVLKNYCWHSAASNKTNVKIVKLFLWWRRISIEVHQHFTTLVRLLFCLTVGLWRSAVDFQDILQVLLTPQDFPHTHRKNFSISISSHTCICNDTNYTIAHLNMSELIESRQRAREMRNNVWLGGNLFFTAFSIFNTTNCVSFSCQKKSVRERSNGKSRYSSR